MSMMEDILKGSPNVVMDVPRVRKRMRDLPKFNEVIEQDLTDDEYADCIIRTIADFNMLSPFISLYTAYDFPDQYMIFDGAIYEALQLLYIWHARNQFSATDAGLQVPIHEQWQPLMQIAERLRGRLDVRMVKLKTQLNIANAMGSNAAGVNSALWLL